ncbi:hypothetical protein HK100_009174 [Physocladia obscura]|uniref:Phosphoesterase n=1 Tax=Physocladia obscura TaxID=109957 RepID=A0AAD5SPT2_9FUNG|nr:hypothetical protein HK100_009174 [Physocladia obscura]
MEVKGQWFERIVITYLENTDYGKALQQAALGGLHAAPHHGTLLTDYHGVAHPSQPNYVALATGDTLVTNDTVRDIDASCIVDLLERRGLTWASYCEAYPDAPGAKPTLDHATGRYVRRHSNIARPSRTCETNQPLPDPLLSVKSVQDNPQRYANIKSAQAFKRDLEAGTLPQLILYTPNQDNNAHDTNTEYAAHYIQRFWTPLMSHPEFTSKRTLFVLTFDESATYIFRDNHVATWLLGTAVKTTPAGFKGGVPYDQCEWEWAIPGSNPNLPDDEKPEALKPELYMSQFFNYLAVFLYPTEPNVPITDNAVEGRFDHYDLLKTIELNWNLGTLGRKDVGAIGLGHLLKD